MDLALRRWIEGIRESIDADQRSHSDAVEHPDEVCPHGPTEASRELGRAACNRNGKPLGKTAGVRCIGKVALLRARRNADNNEAGTLFNVVERRVLDTEGTFYGKRRLRNVALILNCHDWKFPISMSV